MKRLLLLLPAFCIFLGSLVIPAAHASLFQLPKTGQTTSYATGDDGELQMGLAWPTPRFVDNGDQTVTDKLTGLSWTKDANLIKNRDSSISVTGEVTWQGALDYVKKLNSENYLGHNDWRLPNIKELSSLIHRGQADQVAWLTGQGFSNVQNDIYWSSNGLDGMLSALAWYVNIKNSWIMYGSDNSKNSSNYVWPVRTGSTGEPLTIAKSGKSFCYDSKGVNIDCSGTGQDGELQSGADWPSPRFIDNRDKTLTDNLTGLVWSQNGNTPGPANCAPGTAKTWSAALDYVKCLNTSAWLGKTDWRLPNLNELQSLISYGRLNNSDWLKGQGFTNMGINFWSSTTSAANTNIAWGITNAGSTTNSDKTTSADYISIWPVRSGEQGSAASISIAKSGSGSGTITSSPAGIDCGSTCSASSASGQVVTLTATADSGSTFAGWTGCDSSTGNQCTVIVTGTKSVTTTFDLIPTACGSAFGGSFSTSPTANLCATGTASAITSTSTSWNWTCSTGGTPALCSAGRPSSVSTTTIQLPQTGQTVCYDTSGATGGEIPCAATGQDGEKLAGKPWPVPRFTDNNDGSVTDNLTGLIWLKNAACLWTTWQDALDKTKALKGDGSQCGLTDGSAAGQWRLPNRKEMLSLLDRQRQDPALSIGHPFLGFNSYGYYGRFLWYWTSTYFLSAPSFAYIVNMYDGELAREDKTKFTTYVWPVRDSGQTAVVQLPRTGQKDCRPAYGDGGTTSCTDTGQDGDLRKGAPWPVPRLVNNGNGTVTDRLTGLIWLKNAFCTDTVNGTSTNVNGLLSWADALTWSSNLSNGTCGLTDNSTPGDWRLPNITELESLIDVSQANPAYPLNYPFTIPNGGGYYWSSTTTVGDGTVVWNMSPMEGLISNSNGSYYFGKGGTSLSRTWPVRGGNFGDAVSKILPASGDFGTLALGGSTSQVVTISNTGKTSRLQVNSMTLSGTDSGEFSLKVGDGTGGTCGTMAPIISAGGSCTVSLTFNPTSSGAKTANLLISTSDTTTPNTDIPLSGSASVNGTCGTSNGGTFNTAPASNLCVSGTTSTLSGTGPWTWSCNGGGGGTSESCSAAITNFAVTFTAGAHGSLTGTTSQTINYGSTATSVTAIPDPTYAFVNWTEGAAVVGTNATLAVGNVTAAHSYTANFVINYGVCGTSNAGTFPIAPSSNLCTAGTATALSGTGPWSWQCISAYGGATANCSANIRTYTVTPSAGTLITMSPSTPLTINHGDRATFTVTAPVGYGITGSGCGGTLSGTTYTSGVITADCTASFNTVSHNADSTGAGQPTLQDAMKAFYAYSGKLQLSAAEKILYDVAPLGSNGLPVGNGVVDYADIILIMRRLVGIGSW
ncbi:MAG TPA: DUF1566 domain-containing protein [Geobacteraceae bacterium]|nr:DUF1566 domain-containing protein [Geobacteraceae bacterium]